MKIQSIGMRAYLINDKLVYVDHINKIAAYNLIYHKPLFRNHKTKQGLQAKYEHFEIEGRKYMALMTNFFTSGPASGFTRIEIFNWKNCILKYEHVGYGFGYGSGGHIIPTHVVKDGKSKSRIYILCNTIFDSFSKHESELSSSFENAYKNLIVFSDFKKIRKQKSKSIEIDKKKKYVLEEIEGFRQIDWTVEMEIDGENLKIEHTHIPNMNHSGSKTIKKKKVQVYSYGTWGIEGKTNYYVDGIQVEIEN